MGHQASGETVMADPKYVLALKNAIVCAEYAIEKIAGDTTEDLDSDQAMISVEDTRQAVKYLQSALYVLGEDIPGYPTGVESA